MSVEMPQPMIATITPRV